MEEGGVRGGVGAVEIGVVDALDGEIKTFEFAVNIKFSERGERHIDLASGGKFKGEVVSEIARVDEEVVKDEFVETVIRTLTVFMEVESVTITVGFCVGREFHERAVAAR